MPLTSDPFQMSPLAVALADALDSQVCVLDAQGIIRAVNRAWREFAAAHSPTPAALCEGADYLAVCERAALTDAEEARFAAGLRAVLQGQPTPVEIFYQCPSPRQQGWFRARVFPCPAPGAALVIHDDLTTHQAVSTQRDIYHQALESSSNAVALSDLAGELTYVNPAFLALWGYATTAEVLSRPLATLWAEAAEAQAVVTALQQQGTWQGAMQARRADGTLRDLELVAHLVRDAAGQPQCLMASFVDVTPRNQTLTQLRLHEVRLLEAQRLAHLGNWEWNILTGELWWSEEIYRIFGLTPSAFGATYTAFLEAVHPADRALVEAAVNAAVAKHAPYSIEHRVCQPNGTVLTVHERGEVLFNAQGQAVRMTGTVQDITERKRLEIALQLREKMLHTLLTNLPAGLFLVDSAGRFLHVESQALQLSPATFLGQTLADLFPETPAPQQIFARALQGETFREVLPFRARAYEIWVTPMRGATGLVAGVIGVVLDVTAAYATEEALRRSEAKYRALFEHAPIGIALTRDGQVVWCNTREAQLFGYTTPVEAVGESTMRHIHPADHERLAQLRVRLQDEPMKEPILYRGLHTDGSERVIEALAIPFPFEGRSALLSFHIDVTTREQLAQERARADAILRGIFDSIPQGVVLFDAQCRVLALNRQAQPMLQRWGHIDVQVGDDLLAWLRQTAGDQLAAIQQSLQGARLRFEKGYPLPQGEIWVEYVYTPVYLSPTQILGVCLSATDITDRKHSELRLRQLSRVVEQTADAVFITDVHGFIEYVNPAFEALTGFTSLEMMGQRPARLRSGHHPRAFYRQMWEAILRGETWHRTFINRKKDGRLFHEDKTLTPLKDAAGHITHFVSTGRDVTERVQAEAQLQNYYEQLQASLRMGQMVTASLELDAVLARVTQEVARLINAEGAAVLLLKKQQLEFVAVSSPALAGLVGRRLPLDTSVASLAWRTGQAVCLGDTHQAAANYEFLDPQLPAPPRALLAAPLLLNEQVIGVIEAGHPQPDFFSENDLHLLQAAAAWVAIAVNNARQHAALQRRLEENAALAEVSRALNTTLEAAQVLQVIADATRQVLPHVERVVIHLLEETGHSLVPVAGTNFDQAASDVLQLQATPGVRQLQVGEGIAGRVVQFGESINVPDIHADPRYKSLGCATPLRSLLVAPIWSEGRTLGTLSVQSAEPAAFTDEDDALLTTLGINAALALANARLFAAEQRRVREALALHQVTRAISSQMEQEALLEAVVQAVAEVAQYQYVSVFLAEADGLRLAAYRGYAPAQVMQWLPLGAGLVNWVTENQAPLCVPDVRVAPGYVPFVPEVRSCIAVPLVVQTRTVGVLAVEQGGETPLAASDEQWVSSVGQQVSIALENAALYAEQKRLLRAREQAQAQLVQSEKMSALGRLVASLAHEINNPLQAIQGYLTLAEEEVSDLQRPEKIARYLQISTSEIDRIATIVQRMREFYRPARTETLPTEVHAVWQSVLDLTRKKLQHAQVNLQTQWAAHLPTIEANPDHLKQVFLNLVLNAIDAMPAGGTLHLSTAVVTWRDHPAVRVVVRDTGEGMPFEVQSRIFEPFFTSKASGSGLGLSISYSLIQAHAGDLTVTSAPGSGSIFTIFLPTQPPSSDPPLL